MSFLRSSTLAVAVLLTSACASSVDLKRQQSPFYELKSSAPGLSLVSVDTTNVDNSSGMDAATLNAAVKAAVESYVTGQQPKYAFSDATSSGAKADFNVGFKDGAILPSPTATFSAIPQDMATPLVSAIYVMQAKSSQTSGGNTLMSITLAFSTVTKDGKEVKTEIVASEAEGKTPGRPRLSITPDAGSFPSVYWSAQGVIPGALQSTDFLPGDGGELFKRVLADAVGYHYFPLFGHELSERYTLISDGGLKEGADAAKAGNWDAAITSWEKASGADAKAHYNLAVAYMAKGDDAKAQESLSKVSDVPQAQDLANAMKTRAAYKKIIDAQP
ncbi:hypothetical protein D7X99_40065 [Corallococcus sp. AB032C]|nr:hypothetical protein D7X99_40065 [Corallococcus sp. AB032C]